jgi:hypothetical protein
MSELDFGPHEQDYFVYHHLKAASSVRQPQHNVLNPRVSYAFAVQDQINRCRAKGIAEGRIIVGAALADIDAVSEMPMRVDMTPPSEGLHG